VFHRWNERRWRRAGRKRIEITLREVAKEEGVSIATVFHVLTQHPGARVNRRRAPFEERR
jgi:hypothetical protein